MEEYFWSVCLEEGSVQAAIWTIKDNAANVLHVSNSATYEDDETLVTAADSCLSYCIQNLPEDAKEPTKTVFGVPSSWVGDGQIKREHLDKIRLVCNKLSLNPTGFVVLPEAIAHFVKSQEKTPVSGVVIGVYPQNLDISIFRLGNLAGSVTVSRSTDITDDVIEGLARFGKMDTTPSRFLLFDSKAHDLEETRQSLIKVDWESNSEKIKFLHTPQIEIIDPKEKMVAVSLAGASEIAQLTEVVYDVKNLKAEKNLDKKDEGLADGVVEATELGFNVGGDVDSLDLPQANHDLVSSGLERFGKKKIDLNNIKRKFKGFLTILENEKKENFAFIAVIVIFFVVVGLFVAFWFLPKAKVTILISPRKIEGHQKITFDPNATNIDFSKKIIPAKVVSTSVNADKTKTTTGTKTIGTASKGSVTFYNVGDATTIPSGTILTGSSLQFSLDNDVQIASASGAASAATAKANITSVGVGGDYNLASGTFFSVSNFSSSLLQAKNDSDLSGGSSQEVTAVSKDDVNSLVTDLTTQLTNTGKQNLKSQLMSGYLLVDNTVIATPSASDLDHQIGEEAATVKLSMSQKVTGISILRKDMDDLARQIFANQIPSGYVINDNEIDFVFGLKDTDFMINLLPATSLTEIKNLIAGKSPSDVKNILSRKIPGLDDVQIKETSQFPFLNFLPHVADNITIMLQAK